DGDQLREVSDSEALDERARCQAADANRSVRGLEIAEQEGDEGALSRAVRTGQSEHLAVADCEREIVDRAHGAAEQRAIGVADALKLDQGGVTGGTDGFIAPAGGVIPGCPMVGAQPLHAPWPARFIHRMPSSTRPSFTSAQPRKPSDALSSAFACSART